MSKPPLIKHVTSLVAFEPAIKLQAISADLRNRYFKDYILSHDLADVYQKILASILGDGWEGKASTLPAEQRRAHLISAQYGAGKSYFLMILSALLGAAGDTKSLETAKEKFAIFGEVQRLLGGLPDKRFLIIQVSAEDRGDVRFKELLVRTLLDAVGEILPDAAFSNEYSEAIGNLEELESLPTGPAFSEVLEKQFEMTVQQLRAKLSRYDRDGLRTYYQVWERALGRKVSRDVLDVEATYREALHLLKPKGYTHIAVLIDELTAYLNASAAHHSLAETLGELQAFAAFCNNPASRCLLVCAMHVSMRELLHERSQQRDYNKMMGRFEEHPFPIYSSKLLAGVFRPDEHAFDQAMKTHQARVNELGELTELFQMVDDGRPMQLSAFFPLHPAVAHYLPRISRELGQAERTSFGFINDVVRPKLHEPVSRGEELNLVTLDEVFDYFLPAMEQREHYLPIIAAYNAIHAKVREPLAVKAFKPLALLWVASRVRTGPGETQYLDVELSSDQVASYINVADHAAVMEALDALRPTGFVYFDTSTQRYFYSHADPGWDLESEIQEKAADADANDVLQSELRALGFRVCLQVPDTVTVKVDRSVESEWMDVEQLKQATSLKPRRAEGRLVFVVPDFAEMESYDAIFSDISLKARDLSASNVALAVPKKVDVLNPLELKRYRALQEIGKELDVGGRGSVNEHRARLVRARFSEVQSRVQRDIEEFGQASNFIFWVDRKPQEAQAVKTILEDMFEGFYYRFPKVRVERIVGRSTTNALIESCIVNPETTFASDTSEVARQARDTLQVLGLCSWEEAAGGKYVVRLTEPVPGTDGYEIWRIVLDTLTDAAGTPFATLYKRLGQDPYGLPDYLVELYIAAARALSKIYVLDNAGRMPPVSKELVQGITRRKDKDYRVLPVEETEVPYTYTCSVWQAIDEPLGLRHYKELERNLGRSIDDQTVWFDLKADCNNLLLNWLQRVRDNLESIETESRPLMIVMGHLEQIRRILPPAQGLKQLAALGEELSGSKVSDDPDRAALAVRETIEASEQFLTDWDALWSAFRQYKRLLQVSDLDHFGDLARTTEKAWQSYRSDGLSAENRQLFIRRFEDLWEQYAKEYVDEHNAVARARAKYGEAVETSVQYKVLGEFSQLGFEGVATKSSFDAKIKTVRDEGCQALSEDRVRDYRHFGGAACSCGHRLGTGAAILAELKPGEASLSIGVSNALASYHTKLGGVLGSEGMRTYVSERATAKEKTTIASLQDLSGEEPELSATQYGKLEALLPRLRPLLQGAEEYLGAQAEKRKELKKRLEEEQRQKRIPRQRTVHLADAVRSFLLRSGLEAMTLKELEEQLSSWLREIAEEFRR